MLDPIAQLVQSTALIRTCFMRSMISGKSPKKGGGPEFKSPWDHLFFQLLNHYLFFLKALNLEKAPRGLTVQMPRTFDLSPDKIILT